MRIEAKTRHRLRRDGLWVNWLGLLRHRRASSESKVLRCGTDDGERDCIREFFNSVAQIGIGLYRYDRVARIVRTDQISTQSIFSNDHLAVAADDCPRR